MSTEPFIGEVKLLGFNFPPQGYMTCQGQLLPIASYTPLFALIGTYYGGNGQTTFGLPDLRGRVPVGQGQGQGLPIYDMGEVGGTPTVTLLSSNLPAHNHTMNGVRVNIQASSALASEQSPDGTYPGQTTAANYSSAPTGGVYMGGTTVSGTTDVTGGSQSMPILNPFLCMNYSIAVEGIFPSRN